MKTYFTVPLLLFLSGCAALSTPDAVRNRVTSVTGVAYEQTGGLTLGRGALSFARWDSVQGLDKVQLGVYESVEGTEAARPLRAADFRGWDPQLAVRGEDGENVLLLTDGSRSSVRRMLLVVDGREKLVVVLLDGQLDGMLDEAREIAFEEAGVPEP